VRTRNFLVDHSVKRLGYGLEDRGIGVRFPESKQFFSSLQSLETTQWLQGVLSLRWGKREEGEAEQSFPSSAEVKNAWRYTSIPTHSFMTWCLIDKKRDNFA
jgi:hypothetical protein